MGVDTKTRDDLEKLQCRFETLWRRHACAGCESTPAGIFKQLANMYSANWRSYHNLDHISSSLEYFDACKSQAEFADAIEFAIWFHDCIYEVGADDNEARSRDWFIAQTNPYLPPALLDAVDVLIMDTMHNAVPDTNDGKLIADIDLTSFALPWDEYLKDSAAVRGELTHLDDPAALKEKIHFLENLVGGDQIYYSGYYLKHFEQKARDNVHKHLKLLAT